MKNRVISIFLLFMFIFSISGCNKDKHYEKGTMQVSMIKAYEDKNINSEFIFVYPFNTIISMTYFYKEDKDSVQKYALDEYNRMHILFDRHYYYFDAEGELINNLRVINESNGIPVVVDQDLIDIFKVGIEFTKLSKGKFNIGVGSLSSLWDSFINMGSYSRYVNIDMYPLYEFYNGEYRLNANGDYIYDREYDVYIYIGDNRFSYNDNQYVLDPLGRYVYINNIAPSLQQVQEAKLCTPSYENIEDYIVVNDDENTITINKLENCKGDITITLGALAKSYATEKIAEYNSVKNGDFLMNAGQSTIKILGKNVDRTNGEWNIGVTDSYLVYTSENKFASYLMKIDQPLSVSTSSGDEKHYKSGENYYHHIIDPISGYPNQSRLAVTAVTKNAMYADIITTSLMSMNMNETREYIQALKNKNIDVEILVQDKGIGAPLVYASSGIKNKISIRTNDMLQNYLNSLVIEEFNYDA